MASNCSASATRDLAGAIYNTSFSNNTSCSNTTAADPIAPAQAWYHDDWTHPAAWLIIVYCVTSAFTFLLLICHGYLDLCLNLDFSHARAARNELRRRRRHSQRLENWNAREMREAEEIETDMDDEEAREPHAEWPGPSGRAFYVDQQGVTRPSLWPGMSAMQREAVRQRSSRDAMIMAEMERVGLL